jgi:hypothetical protein
MEGTPFLAHPCSVYCCYFSFGYLLMRFHEGPYRRWKLGRAEQKRKKRKKRGSSSEGLSDGKKKSRQDKLYI